MQCSPLAAASCTITMLVMGNRLACSNISYQTTGHRLCSWRLQDAVCHGGAAARQQILGEIAAVLEQGYTSAEGCLCIQAVFSLTDVLKLWLEERRPPAPSPASAWHASGEAGHWGVGLGS